MARAYLMHKLVALLVNDKLAVHTLVSLDRKKRKKKERRCNIQRNLSYLQTTGPQAKKDQKIVNSFWQSLSGSGSLVVHRFWPGNYDNHWVPIISNKYTSCQSCSQFSNPTAGLSSKSTATLFCKNSHTINIRKSMFLFSLSFTHRNNSKTYLSAKTPNSIVAHSTL